MRRALPAGTRAVAVLAAAAVLQAVPVAASAQEATPLMKSELVRMLVSDTYTAEERREIVRRSCLTFTPTARDMEDFRRLGASPELMEVVRSCAGEGGTTAGPEPTPAADEERSLGGAPEAAVEIPPRPAEVTVRPPAFSLPLDSLGLALPVGSGPRTALRAYDARPPRPPPDRGNLLALVDVPPRLRNPAEVQRMLRRAAPQGTRDREGTVRTVLWVYVGPGGGVREARIEGSSGSEAFDRAAREAARSMRFSPATSGGRPIGTWVEQSLALRR